MAMARSRESGGSPREPQDEESITAAFGTAQVMFQPCPMTRMISHMPVVVDSLRADPPSSVNAQKSKDSARGISSDEVYRNFSV